MCWRPPEISALSCGLSSSKWRFLIAGVSATMSQAKGDAVAEFIATVLAALLGFLNLPTTTLSAPTKIIAAPKMMSISFMIFSSISLDF